MLKYVEIEGFKSFGSPGERINLSPLTFLVGPNASGKSNFFNALRFLQQSVMHNVESAVNLFGGVAAVRNKLLSETSANQRYVRMAVGLDAIVDVTPSNVPIQSDEEKQSAGCKIGNFEYEITLDLDSKDGVPVIVDEKLRAKVAVGKEYLPYLLKRNNKDVKISDPITINDPVKVSLTEPVVAQYVFPESERMRTAVHVGFASLPALIFKGLLEGWQFFSISPSVARGTYQDLPGMELGFLGENLSVVVHRHEKLNSGQILREVIGNLQGVIPGFESVKTVPTPLEGGYALEVFENSLPTGLLPANVSDGTIRLIALMIIAALGKHKQEPVLIAIEEPENGLHPHVLGHLVKVLREASQASKLCQVIATTHNPTFLDHLEPQEVLLCGKVDGFSRIKSVGGVREIESFKKHFSLGELWVQGAFDGILE